MAITAIDMLRKYTEKAGDINRQFAIAGIALIWLLNGQELDEPLKGNLNNAFLCITLSLAIDLIQYFLGSLLWFINKAESDATKCKNIIGFTVFLIFLKLSILSIAYYFIICFLIDIRFVVF